jgi:hypothetical protein
MHSLSCDWNEVVPAVSVIGGDDKDVTQHALSSF